MGVRWELWIDGHKPGRDTATPDPTIGRAKVEKGPAPEASGWESKQVGRLLVEEADRRKGKRKKRQNQN